MLEDRSYMRQSPFDSRRSATVMLLIANVLAFVLECVLYGYPPRFPQDGYLALSWTGLQHGYVWQLLTFQFMHGGLLHLLLNCWVIYAFGRELEQALGVKRFLALYFSSGFWADCFKLWPGAWPSTSPPRLSGRCGLPGLPSAPRRARWACLPLLRCSIPSGR